MTAWSGTVSVFYSVINVLSESFLFIFYYMANTICPLLCSYFSYFFLHELFNIRYTEGSIVRWHVPFELGPYELYRVQLPMIRTGLRLIISALTISSIICLSWIRLYFELGSASAPSTAVRSQWGIILIWARVKYSFCAKMLANFLSSFCVVRRTGHCN